MQLQVRTDMKDFSPFEKHGRYQRSQEGKE